MGTQRIESYDPGQPALQVVASPGRGTPVAATQPAMVISQEATSGSKASGLKVVTANSEAPGVEADTIAVNERLQYRGFVMPVGAKRGPALKFADASWRQMFASGHGWAKGGSGTASSADDTSVYLRGSQSVRVTTAGTGNQSYVRKTAMSALDLTGKAIRIVMKVQDVTNLNRIALYVGDTNLANNFEFDFYSHTAGSATAYMQSDQWVTWTVPWAAVTTRAGTRTLTAGVPNDYTGFTDISVATYDNGAGAITYWIDSIEIIPDTRANFSNGVISLTFDDGWMSQFDYGRSYMDLFGYPGTAYLISDVPPTGEGTGSYMGIDRIRRLRDYSGWEIAGHAATARRHNAPLGLASFTEAEVRAEFEVLRMWQSRNGFNSENFAYPKGHWEQTTDGVWIHEIANEYWRTSRTITGGPYEVAGPATPQKVRALTGITDQAGLGGTLVSALTASGGHLDKVKANGGWLILCLHEIITGTPTASTQITNSGFQTLITEISNRGIEVKTVDEVLKYYHV